MDDWEGFIRALFLRFGMTLYENPKIAMKKLKHDAFVAEYQSNFEALSTRVHGMTKEWMVDMFIGRL